MKITDLSIPGLKLVQIDQFPDNRGFFMERFNRKVFEAAGLPGLFAQDNHSRSLPGVIRGMHFQTNPFQGKLVGVVRGRIWDCVVDIRANSKTFGKYANVELSDRSGRLIWIPPGFAHGFQVIGEDAADVVYKVDSEYSQAGEGGILWNDPELAIAWPISGKAAIISARDQALPSFSDYRKSPQF